MFYCINIIQQEVKKQISLRVFTQQFIYQRYSLAYYVGIDPGSSGAYVMLNEQGQIVDLMDFKKSKDGWGVEFSARVSKWRRGDMDICVEDVHSMPGEGVVSCFKFGKNLGYIHGVLDAFGFEYMKISPIIWHKKLTMANFSSADHDPKRRARNVAFVRFGKEVFTGARGGINQGLVDASLIAEYCRQFAEIKKEASLNTLIQMDKINENKKSTRRKNQAKIRKKSNEINMELGVEIRERESLADLLDDIL